MTISPQDGDIPDDIPAALQELSFDSVVSVDDNGGENHATPTLPTNRLNLTSVGMILDSSERTLKRPYDDEEAAEYLDETPAHKRPRLPSHGSGSDSDEEDDDDGEYSFRLRRVRRYRRIRIRGFLVRVSSLSK